jgi:hypothetical protein
VGYLAGERCLWRVEDFGGERLSVEEVRWLRCEGEIKI